MLKIVCWINQEDYSSLTSLMENNIPVNYYGYTFNVEGGSETSGGSSVVSVKVVELINAHISVGLVLPENVSLDGEFELGFISQDTSAGRLPMVCKVSDEVKRATYMGDDIEKLEYLGFTLEQFYHSKGATFYLYDLRESAKPA
ncbi:MAG TPA: hypothetical protein VHT73_01880 [Thermodesulfobacteriota bacterium]|nr:hypothetical protein [Thermodesulfobacteriota bacterium]